jgi:hypothetical protein
VLKYLQIIFLLCLITAGCATLAAKGKTTEVLKPSGDYEDCLELLPGQALDYSFEATGLLDFNIHCHENHKIIYEISKDAVSKDADIFLAKEDQYYCLMWTNKGSRPVTFAYEWSVPRKRN